MYSMSKCLADSAFHNAKPKSTPYMLDAGSGLYLVISPFGFKHWWLQYSFAGEEKFVALGLYPEVSLSKAQELCALCWKVRDAGGDPAEVIKEAKRR